ncbi:hypothetical protein [Actinosynnema sp. NPDC020468]|uniref:hypothetical protein n=1 Tax=Actinosynnema sp. NPDC020468 TaxID=3154488 RepID=UPI0033C34F2E
MSYEEKGAWVYLVVTVAAFVGYAVVTPLRDGTPYVANLLWALGIAVVGAIVLRVLVEVVRPSERHRADERDREVRRRGEYVGGVVLGVAMVGPFGLALADRPHFWIANAMYLAYVLAAVVGTAVKLVGYRRGW